MKTTTEYRVKNALAIIGLVLAGMTLMFMIQLESKSKAVHVLKENGQLEMTKDIVVYYPSGDGVSTDEYRSLMVLSEVFPNVVLMTCN